MDTYVDKFMKRFQYEGLTFDDVSLVTQYADFLPDKADTTSRFSRNVKINIPFASAAMDTVTESNMAIAMACLGGIGVIHKNLDVEDQAKEVKKVKQYLNGFIKEPVTFNQTQTVEEMLREKEKRKYSFSGFPIINNDGKLVGILTTRDLKFLNDYSLTLDKVMTKNLITAPVETQLKKAFEIMCSEKVGKLPLLDDKGNFNGIYSFHDVRTLIDNIEPDYNRDSKHQLRVAAAVGPYDEARIDALAKVHVDVMVIDTAHGDSKGVLDTIKMVKDRHPDIDVIAGNIATGSAAKRLADAGADGIKVGIGPGSICTTRVVAGVGIPQLTAVYEARKAVGDSIPIIADGGIKQSGDVAKAIAVGASSVMMGSALAGTHESPGEKILHHGRRYVVYRGMGSLEAMEKAKGSRERYGQKDVEDSKKLVPQGIEGLVLYRGPVGEVIHQFVGGLKYSMGYCGTKIISELQTDARFVRVSGAGLIEAHPHDIKITKDAPNYMTE